jgi:hypothetical protein
MLASTHIIEGLPALIINFAESVNSK